MTDLHYIDPASGAALPLNSRAWRGASGQPLDLGGLPPFDPRQIDRDVWSLWRYRAFLPLPADARPVTLGEGMTPLVPADLQGRTVYYKLEFMAPTGSYKDRGVTTLISGLKAADIDSLIEDSSGNAGTAVAAYAAAAGMRAHIFVPDHASPAKKAQIRVYGADLAEIPGGRAATTDAAIAAAEHSLYASHAWNPLFNNGLRTAAWEVWEQLGRAPDVVITPVGQGGLLLGMAEGFRDLLDAQCIDQLPRMIGVQAAAVAPVYQAWRDGLVEVPTVPEAATIAEGVRIRHPVRAEAILAAVRETNGVMVAANDHAVEAARADLARQGLFVEPTSALVLAGLYQIIDSLPRDAIIVAPLTGSGLKSPPTAG